MDNTKVRVKMLERLVAAKVNRKASPANVLMIKYPIDTLPSLIWYMYI